MFYSSSDTASNEAVGDLSFADQIDRKRLPALPLGITATMLLVLGYAYQQLRLPHSNLIFEIMVLLGGFIFLLRFPLPAFLFPNHTHWLTHVVFPAVGFVLAVFYLLSGLHGGIVIALGIFFSLLGLSFILSTNLFLSLHNDSNSILFKTLPFTSIFLAIFFALSFYFMGKGLIGFAAASACLLIVPAVFVFERYKYQSVLFFTMFMLGVWPIVNHLPKSRWLMNGWGFFLITIAIIRLTKKGLPRGMSATAIYISGSLYLVWLIITLLTSPLPDTSSVFKILGDLGQLLFLFGILQNLRSRHDLKASLYGYLTGVLVVILFTLQNYWYQIVHFNVIVFLVLGIRATVGDEAPGFIAIPAFTAFLIGFAFVVKRRGPVQYKAIAVCVVSFLMVILSGSRSFFLTSFVIGLYMSANSPKLRRVLITCSIVILCAFLVAYFINPYVTRILTRTRELDSGRFALWQVAWNMFLQHPILGRGPSSSQFIFPQYMSRQWYSYYDWAGGRTHNVFFSEVIETGIVGFILLVILHYFVWRWIKRIPDKTGSPWKLAGMGIFLAFALTSFSDAGEILFVNPSICLSYHPVLAMLLATGAILPAEEQRISNSTTG